MACVQFVRALRPWDPLKHADYKVRNLVFECPSHLFREDRLSAWSITSWEEGDITVGIATARIPVRVSACKLALPHGVLYRSKKSDRATLVSFRETPQSDKDLTRACFDEYLTFLSGDV